MNNLLEELKEIEKKFKEVQDSHNELIEVMKERISTLKSIISIQDKLLEISTNQVSSQRKLLIVCLIWIVISTIIHISHLF